MKTALVSVDASITSLGGQGIKIGSVTLVNPSGKFAYTGPVRLPSRSQPSWRLPGSPLGTLAAEVPVNDEDPITVTVPADISCLLFPMKYWSATALMKRW